MNENKELSPETIRILYKDCLYGLSDNADKNILTEKTESNAEVSSEQKSLPQKKVFQKKKFIVITDNPLVQNLADQRFKLLSDIIKACKLELEDGYITDILHEGKDHNSILELYQPDVFLLFGINSSDIQLPMIFPDFQIQRIGKHIYISAPALETLEPDKTSKTKLWNCLKQVFQ